MGKWNQFKNSIGFGTKEDSTSKQKEYELRQINGKQPTISKSKQGHSDIKAVKTNLSRGLQRDESLRTQKRGNTFSGAAVGQSTTREQVYALPAVHRTMPGTTANSKKSAASLHVDSNDVLSGEGLDTAQEPNSNYEEKNMKKIQEIREKSKEFEKKIETFLSVPGSDKFFYIDENLLRNIEKLDRIDTSDSILLQKEVKHVIQYIYLLIEKLEEKAKENERKILKEEEEQLLNIVSEVKDKTRQYYKEVNTIQVVEICQHIYSDLQKDIQKLKSIDTKGRDNLEKAIRNCYSCINQVMQKLKTKEKEIQYLMATQNFNVEDKIGDTDQTVAGNIQVADEVTEGTQKVRENEINLLEEEETGILKIVSEVKRRSRQYDEEVNTVWALERCEQIYSELKKHFQKLISIDANDSEYLREVIRNCCNFINQVMQRVETKANEIKSLGATQNINVNEKFADSRHSVADNIQAVEKVTERIQQTTLCNYEIRMLDEIDEISIVYSVLNNRIGTFSDIPNSQEYNSIVTTLQMCINKLNTFDTRHSERLENKIDFTIGDINSNIEKMITKAKENANKLSNKHTVTEESTNNSVPVEDQPIRATEKNIEIQEGAACCVHKKYNEIGNESTIYEEKGLKRVSEIMKMSEKLDGDICSLSDISGSPQFNFILVNLQTNMQELQSIDTKDSEKLFAKVKYVLNYIYWLIAKLVAKAKDNELIKLREDASIAELVNKIIYKTKEYDKQVDSVFDVVRNKKIYLDLQQKLEEMNTIDTKISENLQKKIKHCWDYIQRIVQKIELFHQIYEIVVHSNTLKEKYMSDRKNYDSVIRDLQHLIAELNDIDAGESELLSYERQNAIKQVYDVLGSVKVREKEKVKHAENDTCKISIANEQIVSSSTGYSREEDALSSTNTSHVLNKLDVIMDAVAHIEGKIDTLDYGEFGQFYGTLQGYNQKLIDIDTNDSEQLRQEVNNGYDYIASVVKTLLEKYKENRLTDQATSTETVSAIIDEDIIDQGNKDKGIRNQKSSSAYFEQCLQNIYEIIENSEALDKKLNSILDVAGSEEYNCIAESLQKNMEILHEIDARDSTLLKLHIKRGFKCIDKTMKHLEQKAKENEHMKLSKNCMLQTNISDGMSRSSSNKYERTIMQMEKQKRNDDATNKIKPAEYDQSVGINIKSTVESKHIVQAPVPDDSEQRNSRKINDVLRNSNELNERISSFLDVVDSNYFNFIDSELQWNIKILNDINTVSFREKVKDAVSYVSTLRYKLTLKAKENRQNNLSIPSNAVDSSDNNLPKENRNEHRPNNTYNRDDSVHDISKRLQYITVNQLNISGKKIQECNRKSEEIDKVIDSFIGSSSSHEYRQINSNIQVNVDVLNSIYTGNDEYLRTEKEYGIKYSSRLMNRLNKRAKENQLMKLRTPTSL